MSKKFTASGACSMHPTGTTPPMDFKLAQYACDLRHPGRPVSVRAGADNGSSHFTDDHRL